MTYLMAQIVFFLLVAAAIGFIVGWFLRHLTARRNESVLTAGWERRFDQHSAEAAALHANLQRETADLAAANKEVTDVRSTLAARDAEAKDLDLRLGAAETQSEELQRSLQDRDLQVTDLQDELHGWRDKVPPLQAQLAEEQGQVAALTSELETWKRRVRPLEQDSAQLQQELSTHQRRIRELEAKLGQQADLAAALEQRNNRIGTLEAQLAQLAADRRATVVATRSAPPLRMERPARLFSSPPTHPDDLKKIRGIGQVLERTLNALGVYQFQQIAQFTPADIAWVDDHLEAFKGRIERDNWVNQARQYQQRS